MDDKVLKSIGLKPTSINFENYAKGLFPVKNEKGEWEFKRKVNQ